MKENAMIYTPDPGNNKESSRWLVTGGCGFIGTNLISHLLKKGIGQHIRVIDNLSVGSRHDLAGVCRFVQIDPRSLKDLSSDRIAQSEKTAVELIVGDIRDPLVCLTCCEGVDVVVHLAANSGVAPSVKNPGLDMEVNVLGTFNMLEAARQKEVRRFVFASSGAPIGEVQPPIHEELAPHPVSPYGAGKLAGEAYCSAYFRTYNLETVVLRFGNVYGPRSGHKSSVVARFIRQAMQNETLEIYGDGSQTRDFIFINDLVRAIDLAASTDGVGGEIFQIATSRETAVSELIERLKAVLSAQGLGKMAVRMGEPRKGDVKRNFSDTSKAQNILKWKAETPLREGLALTAEWFRQFYSDTSKSSLVK